MSNTIDITEFVEVPEGQSTLCFPDEKQQARFELGVSMMVHKWDALDTAVENQWGGPDSEEKRDWITGIVVDLFKLGRVVDVALIEETLLYAMVDEFETNVEDDSALPISKGILDLYNQCYALQYGTVEELYSDWLEKQKTKKVKKNIHIHNDDDESSSDDNGSGDEDEDFDMDEQAQERPNLIQEPIIDDDGFELVQKKGKGRKY
ncbi:hypothetical protein NCAS_0J01900 [Naumovozyma castellii]|uniref:Pre-rRNA-processing protein TSR2 n=1 Tax=Naumovozyma castellii TaxID=27288 RepID=G0VKY1_NAUCA|nr:hypothetical protein NCAS_0J01900 [Naumovozyma castellii CBS 4309]CCC72169.1 hypothetical protein NCAS_0J01900 [Naumovozyma castellii CBS 4309]